MFKTPHFLSQKGAITLLLAAILAGPSAAQDGDLELDADFAAAPAAAPGGAPVGSVGGMGDINLYPRRIVIDRRQRIATVGLYNRSISGGDYEITVMDMIMTPDGRVVPLDRLPEGTTTDRLQPASAMLRYSPRRVTLAGNEAQTIRIMARPAAELPDGEYRAHFSVVAIPPPQDEGLTIDEAAGGEAAAEGRIGVVIRPRFGITIPVIVRVGETTLDVGLQAEGLVEIDGQQRLALVITRSGTRSAYGDIEVSLAGMEEPIGVVRGIGVYPEVDSRRVTIPLTNGFDPARLRPGMVLTITYTDDDVSPGAVFATQNFIVP